MTLDDSEFTLKALNEKLTSFLKPEKDEPAEEKDKNILEVQRITEVVESEEGKSNV